MTAPISVLLVDDHSTMRMGFRMILEASGIAVSGEAATGREALHAVRGMRPDVVFMDVQMPDLDGIEATRLIRAELGDDGPSIVIVTTFDRDDYLFSALEAGASGFLLKNAGPEELVQAARSAASGDALLAPEVTRRVIERFATGGTGAHDGTQHGGTGTAARGRGSGPAAPGPATGAPPTTGAPPGAGSPADGRPMADPVNATAHAAISFTEREAEVLRLLARAMSNAEIAAELFIGDATVKTHVSNVLLKLGARDRVAAVVWAHRNGFA
ncbi:response regulator [Microbacterium halophytorum]|uniref:response regulator n=1 Tax=Microbacterium halophytorum TaxID=2067568 RepID=UPI000CFAEE56|nr:response regulator transcription factor [Microbacterium halophytorum]